MVADGVATPAAPFVEAQAPPQQGGGGGGWRFGGIARTLLMFYLFNTFISGGSLFGGSSDKKATSKTDSDATSTASSALDVEGTSLVSSGSGRAKAPASSSSSTSSSLHDILGLNKPNVILNHFPPHVSTIRPFCFTGDELFVTITFRDDIAERQREHSRLLLAKAAGGVDLSLPNNQKAIGAADEGAAEATIETIPSSSFSAAAKSAGSGITDDSEANGATDSVGAVTVGVRYPTLRSDEARLTPPPAPKQDVVSTTTTDGRRDGEGLVESIFYFLQESWIAAVGGEDNNNKKREDTSSSSAGSGDASLLPNADVDEVLFEEEASNNNYVPETYVYDINAPIKNITKRIDLRRCVAFNCTLTAHIAVRYTCQGSAPRVIEFDHPVVTHSERYQSQLVSLFGNTSSGSSNGDSSSSSSNDPMMAMTMGGGSGDVSASSSSKGRIKRQKTKIDLAIEHMIETAKKLVFSSSSSAASSTEGAEGSTLTVADSGTAIATGLPATGTGKAAATARSSNTKVVQLLQPSITISPVVQESEYPVTAMGPLGQYLLPVRDPHPTPSERSRRLPALATPNSGAKSRNEGRHHVDFYAPVIYLNQFWVLDESLVLLNATNAAKQTVTLSLEPVSLWKFIMFTQLDDSFARNEEWGLLGPGERDITKKIFVDTNIVLLVVTMVVSLLHSVFEMLAMKNDVQFWRQKKNYSGLSLRSIVLNCYFQLIIFLYLFDSEETSYMVLIPSAFGVLIEFYKLRKTLIVERDPQTQRLSIHFTKSYDSQTRRYDQEAMKWLGLILAPFLLAYTIYSALYHEHKGWYSFLIRTQVRFIYFSGFVMMTPQIFINYKLKSVMHLPWRTFIYRFLNTIVDDLFAFVITMPWLHRLACFRDDIVFVVLLYQRWLYPVDMNRTEEGLKDEDDSPATAAAAGEASKAKPTLEEDTKKVEAETSAAANPSSIATSVDN